jgi:hypothetical protein
MRRSLAAFALVATLTGCSAQDDLAQCLDETEPIILLRQLNLTGTVREQFERCRENRNPSAADVCAALYLDASVPVLNCMKRHGWTFASLRVSRPRAKRTWQQWFQPRSPCSSVLAELGDQFPQGLKAHLDTYQVDDADGLALLFRQMDNRKSGRTPTDVSGAYQGLYPDLQDIPRDAAKLAVEGAAWYEKKVEGLPAPSGDDVYTLFGKRSLHSFHQVCR